MSFMNHGSFYYTYNYNRTVYTCDWLNQSMHHIVTSTCAYWLSQSRWDSLRREPITRGFPRCHRIRQRLGILKPGGAEKSAVPCMFAPSSNPSSPLLGSACYSPANSCFFLELAGGGGSLWLPLGSGSCLGDRPLQSAAFLPPGLHDGPAR